MHFCHLQRVKQLVSQKKVAKHETVNEPKTKVRVKNEERDSAHVDEVIQCVCGPLGELSLLANKVEVGENKALVA